MAEPTGEGTEQVQDEEEVECSEAHLADLDETTRRFLQIFSTIRSKLQDMERAQSDISRFALSIEQQRKQLEKNLDSASTALKNARIQMSVELGKLDPNGFTVMTQLLKEKFGA